MPRKRAFVLAALVACGSFGESSSPPATERPQPPFLEAGSPVDAGARVDVASVEITPAFLQESSAETQLDVEAMTLAIPLKQPTAGGNLLIVAVGNETGVGSVSSVTDANGTPFLTANARSARASGDCELSSEIWYLPNVKAGVQQVTVTMSESVAFSAWVIEAAGLSTTAPLDKAAHESSEALVLTVAAPKVTPASARAFIVSTACTCSPGLTDPGNDGFTNLAPHFGNRTAWRIADAAGAYGAAWPAAAQAGFTASTAAFKP